MNKIFEDNDDEEEDEWPIVKLQFAKSVVESNDRNSDSDSSLSDENEPMRTVS